jgi:ABC-2 type transporter
MGLLLGIMPRKSTLLLFDTRISTPYADVRLVYFIGMLMNLASYPSERHVFVCEHDDITYTLEAFFVQYLTMEVPLEIITSLVFAVFADIAVNLPRTPGLFWLVAFNAFCLVNCGESVGLIFNTLFAHTGFAANLTTVLLSLATCMGGEFSFSLSSRRDRRHMSSYV